MMGTFLKVMTTICQTLSTSAKRNNGHKSKVSNKKGTVGQHHEATVSPQLSDSLNKNSM